MIVLVDVLPTTKYSRRWQEWWGREREIEWRLTDRGLKVKQSLLLQFIPFSLFTHPFIFVSRTFIARLILLFRNDGVNGAVMLRGKRWRKGNGIRKSMGITMLIRHRFVK